MFLGIEVVIEAGGEIRAYLHKVLHIQYCQANLSVPSSSYPPWAARELGVSSISDCFFRNRFNLEYFFFCTG